jgi:hypothetical protein
MNSLLRIVVESRRTWNLPRDPFRVSDWPPSVLNRQAPRAPKCREVQVARYTNCRYMISGSSKVTPTSQSIGAAFSGPRLLSSAKPQNLPLHTHRVQLPNGGPMDGTFPSKSVTSLSLGRKWAGLHGDIHNNVVPGEGQSHQALNITVRRESSEAGGLVAIVRD